MDVKGLESIEDFDNLLIINRKDLADVVSHQAEIYRLVGKKWVEAVEKEDTAKNILVMLKNKVAIKLRAEILDKLTEAKLKELVESDIEVITQNLKYLEYKSNATNWENLKEAFSQRKDMLGHLSKLHMEYYYTSGAGVPDRPAKLLSDIAEEMRASATKE